MTGEETNQNLTSESVVVETIPSSKDSPNQHQHRPPGWRKFLFPTLIGLTLLSGVGWIVLNRVILPMMFAGKMTPQPTPVPLANPKTATIEDSSDYAASLDSRQSVTLQPQVSGRVSAIFVRAGDRVAANQPILQIHAAEQRAQVASRRSAADTAAAEVESARADVVNAMKILQALEARRASAAANVELNRQEYKRYEDLLSEGATSRQVVEQRLNALRTAEAALQEADAEIQAQRSAVNRTKSTVTRNQRALEQAQANITEGQAQLQNYTVVAPFSGMIGDIPAKVGDVVSPTTQLLSVTQNQQLEIQIQVPLERASALRVALPVRLLNDQNQVLQTGRVSFIAPNVDPATQSVQTKATFANVGNLRTSQFVRARVVWSKRRGVIVPTTTISRLGGRDFIFVAAPFSQSGCPAAAPSQGGQAPQVKPDQLVAVQKPIKLGKIVGNDQEVLDGLSASDRIVTSGILQLQNCAPISEAAPSAPTS
jgi:multidrug efflux pump subunit AcrA (membrane-fusion protein)